MRKIRKLMAVICILSIFSFVTPAFAADNTNRVYFFNVAADGVAASDCILIKSGSHYGLIDSGHRSNSKIQDSNGMVYDVYEGQGLSCSRLYKNGKDIAYFMDRYLGVKHLDFIIGTHAHSDHIGGVPEIADYTMSNGRHLVDDKTVYFYKEYRHVNATNDDIAYSGGRSWHNQAFAYQAKTKMKNRNAKLLDLANGLVIGKNEFAPDTARVMNALNTSNLRAVQYFTGNASDYFDDYFEFKMGTLDIKLFNLYSHNTSRDDNVNSICALVSDGKLNFVSTGDINVQYYAEQKIAKAMASVMTGSKRADLYKAAHHGNAGSNAFETMQTLKPHYMVATRVNYLTGGKYWPSTLTPVYEYCRNTYGTSLYEVGASDHALVATFNGNNFAFNNLYYTTMNSASKCLGNGIGPQTYEATYYNFYGNNKDDDILTTYYYQNGHLTPWLNVRNRWYALSYEGARTRTLVKRSANLPNGSYVKGGKKIEGIYYAFDGNGALMYGNGWKKGGDNQWYYLVGDHACGGWKKIRGDWYLFNWSNGSMITGWGFTGGKAYYFNGDGTMVTGWRKIGNKWFYFDGSGALQKGGKKIRGEEYLFKYANGEMITGWYHSGNGNWYYYGGANDGAMRTGWQKINGYWYYFNGSGSMRTASIRWRGKTYYFYSNGVCRNP